MQRSYRRHDFNKRVSTFLALIGRCTFVLLFFLWAFLVTLLIFLKNQMLKIGSFDSTDAIRITLALVILFVFLAPAVYISALAFEFLITQQGTLPAKIGAPSRLTTSIFKFADSDETTFLLFSSIGMPIIVAYFSAEESKRGKSSAALILFSVLIAVFILAYFPSLAQQNTEWRNFIEGLADSFENTSNTIGGSQRILEYIEGIRQAIITTLAALAGIKAGVKA